MIKMSEFVANIRNLREGGLASDDVKLSDRQYAFIGLYYREKLINQRITKGQSLEGLHQTLKRIDLRTPEIGEVPETGDAFIYRSKTTLPVPVNGAQRLAISYVGDMDGHTSYQETSLESFNMELYNKWTSALSKWFMHNGYIYVVNPETDGNTSLMVKGVFSDPVEVHKFNKEYNPMNGLNYDLPIPRTMLDTIYKLMTDSELRLSSILPSDELNNGRDD